VGDLLSLDVGLVVPVALAVSVAVVDADSEFELLPDPVPD
jgi:hypothetical protein